MRAVGRLVCGANLLERMLLLMVVQLRADRDGHFPSKEEMAYLGEASAGKRLGLLRESDIPADLEGRIDDVVKPRNGIVHHLFESLDIAQAVVSGEGMDAVVKQIEQVALDCGKIGVELLAVAGANLEARMGKTPAELVELLAAIDPESVADTRLRKQLEVAQAMRGVDLSPPWQIAGDNEADSSPA